MPFRRSPKLSYSPTAGEIFQLTGYRPKSQLTGSALVIGVKRASFPGAIEQFAGSAAEFVGYVAAEHASDLLGAIAGFQNRHTAASRAAPLFFLDGEMTVRERRDLRQVRDTQNLMKVRELFQFAANHLGNCAADSRVHFVENHR